MIQTERKRGLNWKHTWLKAYSEQELQEFKAERARQQKNRKRCKQRARKRKR